MAAPKTKKPGALLGIAKRLREPSTMAGLSLLATLAGAPPGVSDAVMQGLSAVLAGLAVVMTEHKPE